MLTSEVITRYDNQGNPLSPYEASTGVVLPITPGGVGRTNKHHAHFSKEDHENLKKNGTPETRAVRFSRLQTVAKGRHRAIHERVFGSYIQENIDDIFVTTIWNTVGYVPLFGIDVINGELEVVELSTEQREELLKPGVFSIEKKVSRQAELGQFLMNYAIWQNFDHVNQSYIGEFLAIKPREMLLNDDKREQKFRLGMKLINTGIAAAVERISRPYNQARAEAAVPLGKPACAWAVVKEYVAGFEPDYFEPLEDRLLLEYPDAA